MQAFPYRIDLAPGETATVEVHVTRNGYCGPIDVAVDHLPETVHAETTSVSWPAAVATVQLTAADALSDEIRISLVRTWTSHESRFEFKLRTRAAAEPNWSDEVVGIPDAETMGYLIWVDENRVVFSDFERNAPDEVTPVLRCIDLGVGRCADFGESGLVPLEPRPLLGYGNTSLARAPDGSIVVATGVSEPTATTTWGRVTRAGDWLPFPAIASAATDHTAVGHVAVDSNGRILFLARPDGSSGTSTLVRLNPDGSVDESFGDGGSVPALWMNRVHLVPDGRIVLEGSLKFVWLDEDGTPIGAPVNLDNYHYPAEVLPNGDVIYGQIIPVAFESSTERGSVTLVDSTGNVVGDWELGLDVEPLAFLLGGEEPLVIARVDGFGLLRIMRLPLDDDPIIIAERTVGSSVGRASAIDAGSLFVLGTRSFRLPDGAVYWREAFVWRLD